MSEGGERRVGDPVAPNLFLVQEIDRVPVGQLDQGDLVIFDHKTEHGGTTITALCEWANLDPEHPPSFAGTVLSESPRVVGQMLDIPPRAIEELLLDYALSEDERVHFTSKAKNKHQPRVLTTEFIDPSNGNFFSGQFMGVRQVLRSPSFSLYDNLRNLRGGISLTQRDSDEASLGRDPEFTLREKLLGKSSKFIANARQILEATGQAVPDYTNSGTSYFADTAAGSYFTDGRLYPCIAVTRARLPGVATISDPALARDWFDQIAFIPAGVNPGFVEEEPDHPSNPLDHSSSYTAIGTDFRYLLPEAPATAKYTHRSLGQNFSHSVHVLNFPGEDTRNIMLASDVAQVTSRYIGGKIGEYVVASLGRKPTE
jgi:hypothetical protein